MSGVPPPYNRRRLLVAGVVGATVVSILAVAIYFRNSTDDGAVERDAALALAEQGPPAEALAALRRCLERHPDDPALLRAIVRVLPRAGATPPDVEPYTARWYRAAPNDVEAVRARLAVLQKLHRKAESIEPAERVLALDPNDHDARTQLADLYLAVGQYDGAAREYKFLLDSAPLPRAELLARLGRVEATRGNNSEAARVLDQATAGAPDHPGALLMRGIVHQQVGEDEAAVAVLRRVKARSQQERVVVLHHMSLSLSRLGRADDARQAFDDLIKMQDAIHHRADAEGAPNDAGRQARAGRSLLAAGFPQEAAQGIEAAIGRIGPNREMLTILADCYDRLDSPELAKSARARATQLPP